MVGVTYLLKPDNVPICNLEPPSAALYQSIVVPVAELTDKVATPDTPHIGLLVELIAEGAAGNEALSTVTIILDELLHPLDDVTVAVYVPADEIVATFEEPNPFDHV